MYTLEDMRVGDYLVTRRWTDRLPGGEAPAPILNELSLGTVAILAPNRVSPSWDEKRIFSPRIDTQSSDGTWTVQHDLYEQTRLRYAPMGTSPKELWRDCTFWRMNSMDESLHGFSPGRNPFTLLGPLELRVSAASSFVLSVTTRAVIVYADGVDLKVEPKPCLDGLLHTVRYRPHWRRPWTLLVGERYHYYRSVELLPSW